MVNVTGHIKPMTLANMIHAAPSPNGIAYSMTLQNIRDCIAMGDEWFVETVSEGWRVFTNTGFSARVFDGSFLTFDGRALCA